MKSVKIKSYVTLGLKQIVSRTYQKLEGRHAMNSTPELPKGTPMPAP